MRQSSGCGEPRDAGGLAAHVLLRRCLVVFSGKRIPPAAVVSSGRSFWSLYARVYDGLRKVVPYQRLVEHAVAGVPATARSLLDAGCGTGNLLEAARAERPSLALHGIDRSSAMLDRARRRVPGATFVEGDLDVALPWPDATFDAVVCINVLYAVTDVERTVSELFRVLRPGGILIASGPGSTAKLGPLVLEHARVTGWARTLPLLGRLAALTGLNLYILFRGYRGKYHFLDAERVRRLLRADTVETAYAAQNWFVRLQKNETIGTPQ